MRVLFLPHGRRHNYFIELLRQARETAGWEISVICEENARDAYDGIVASDDHVYALPDFAVTANDIDMAANVRLIAGSEQASDIPVNRLILASERDIGRAFGLPAYHWPLRRVARRALADNSFPRRVVYAQFAFMDDVIRAANPDLILTGNFASPHHTAAAMIAAHRGIPALSGRSSKIFTDRTFWTRDIAMLNTDAESQYAANAKAARPVSAMAYELIDKFRNKPSTVGYIARYWKSGDAETWLSRHRFFVELLVTRVAHKVRRRTSAPRPVLPAVAEYYRTRYLAGRQRKFFSRPETAELTRQKYVYLPFHKEPELAINFQAPSFHNQYETAAQISAALPHDAILIVREHRLNRGRRPTRYYRALAALPNVVLADPFDDQFKYIRHAEVIITDNGSSGWEGLLLGRRVITLARTFYDSPGIGVTAKSIADLPKLLLEALGGGTPHDLDSTDRRLGWLIDAEFETTTSEDADGHAESIRKINDDVSRRAKTGIER
ncbi:MAG: hypothetical protein ABJ215_02125 [Alphaproteobacteria bacterium]